MVSRVYDFESFACVTQGSRSQVLSAAVLISIRCLISDQVPEMQIALKLQKRNRKGPQETAARRKYCSERSPWLSRLSGTLFQVPNRHTNTNLGKLASTRPCCSSKQAIISELFNVQRAIRIRVNSTNSMMLIDREVEHSRPHHSLLFFLSFFSLFPFQIRQRLSRRVKRVCLFGVEVTFLDAFIQRRLTKSLRGIAVLGDCQT